MAPCDLERRETVGDISISMYSIWQNCGGGYDIIARNGSELERIHTRSQRQADETFAMLVGKYGDQTAQANETLYAFAGNTVPSWYGERFTETALAQASQEARELRAWATGR
jgi:hypothetical protein